MLTPFTSRIFLSRSQRRLCRGATPVYVWHCLGAAPKGVGDPYLYTSAADFHGQLVELKSRGFESGTLTDALKPGDRQQAVITFDDGCRNVLRHGLAPLAEHGMKAIQFIVAGMIGRRNEWDRDIEGGGEALMDAGEIRDWLAAGHEIGSHSLTHRNLANRTESEAREQIFASKKLLEDTFQVPIRHFCYPHGRWTPCARDLVAEAGYETACTTEFGIVSPGDLPHTLMRIFPLSAAGLAGKAWHRLVTRRVTKLLRGG